MDGARVELLGQLENAVRIDCKSVGYKGFPLFQQSSLIQQYTNAAKRVNNVEVLQYKHCVLSIPVLIEILILGSECIVFLV